MSGRLPSKPRYEPPSQSPVGQIVDSILILLLVVLSLFAPVYFGLAGDKKLTLDLGDKSWEALHQNATAQAQWVKLDYTPQSAHDIIVSRFDYTFSWTLFAVTALVIIGYFFFIILVSDKEYKDVIAERFDGQEPRR